MSRLALLTPLPPAATGIADYSLEVAALIAPSHELDLFHGGASSGGALPDGVAAFPASEFLTRHAERPYDLPIYQLGNGPAHDFLYDVMPRVPGLLVLHDLVLHHARARMFLDAPAVQAYRAAPASTELRAAAEVPLASYAAEVAYSHPEAAGRLPDVQLSTVGDLLAYAYPLFRLPVESARAIAVHNEFTAEAVRAVVPDRPVLRIAMPMSPLRVDEGDVRAVRARHGIAPGDRVVGCFGLLTREKRLTTVARAVARASRSLTDLRLLLVGPVSDEAALRRELEVLGVLSRTVITGRVPLEALPAYMEAADVVAHLRYPTARETSAALLRVLAQGRPTAISDLEHQAHIPADAVLRLSVSDEEGELTRALHRLFGDSESRLILGARAAAFVARAHSPALARAGYEAAIAAALRAPAPSPRDWPAHWPRSR